MSEIDKLDSSENPVVSAFLREYAYDHGSDIYKFMNKYGIGKSSVGSMMDKAAQGKHVVAHRLYGHHIVYDLPIDNPQDILPFLEHELSDIFTKQGLPILPGELLKNNGLLQYCNKLTNSWGFVNGFDILTATVSIYKSYIDFKKAFNEETSVASLEDIAKTLGLGTFELVIAISTYNPFLFIGAILQMTAGIRGMMNEACVVRFVHYQRVYRIDIVLDDLSLSNIQEYYSLECVQNKYNLANQTNYYKINS